MAKKQPMGEFDVEAENPSPELASSPAPKSKVKHVTDDWDAKDHLNTLAQAHAIMMDPKKMAKVKKLAKFHKRAIRSTDDIKQYHQEAYGPNGKGPMPVDNDQDGE